MNKLINFTLSIACICTFYSCAGDDDSDGESGIYLSNELDILTEMSGDKFSDFSDNPFIDAKENSVSTFSVDADGASYSIMRKYLKSNWKVEKNSVRIEEFLNYFTFNYQEPTDDNTVAINSELGTCPWDTTHYLLRLGIKGKALTEIPQSNYVFLIDVSGSMSSENKLPLFKKCLMNFVENTNPEDRISIVTYSGDVRLLLESTPAKESKKINSAIEKLSADGCTNGGDALKMAYREALNNYIEGGNNRVILGTDGDFNFGITSTDELLELVSSYADKGIYMTTCGFGSGNLNDAMMEKISNRGNGTYEYIDCENQMLKVFLYERSKFYAVASDSKCQITFNNEFVSQYRLIGYENRVLNTEDFTDDKKDAGEIGASQTITALYEIIPNNNAKFSDSDNIAKFDFRYKKALNLESITLNSSILPTSTLSNEFYFASGVAAFGMLLRESEYKGSSTFDLAADLVKKGLDFDPNGYRAELLELILKSNK